MNLAMQLRRALFTLGLTAVAIVCVAATSSPTVEMRTKTALDATPAVSVIVAKQVLDVAHIATVVRDAAPVRMSKVLKSRKSISVRCENIKRG